MDYKDKSTPKPVSLQVTNVGNDSIISIVDANNKTISHHKVNRLNLIEALASNNEGLLVATFYDV